MTDQSKGDNIKNEKKKLIDQNFTSVKSIGLTSAKLIPYTSEIVYISKIQPIPHSVHIEKLKEEINVIYNKITGDSEDLDSYDGSSIYEGGNQNSDTDISSSDSDSSYDSMDEGSVYGDSTLRYLYRTVASHT